MALYSQIKEDLVNAMKAKQAERLSVLRMVKKAIDDERIASGDRENDPADDLVIKVLKRYKKQLEDSLKDFQAGGRDADATAVKSEIDTVSTYLPEEMGDAQIDSIVGEVLAEIPEDQRDFGRVMGVVMKKVAGQADGNRVRARLQAALGK